MAAYVEKCIVNYKYLFHPDLLKGKTALVTGGGSGIGFTIAEVLMRHQCKTAIVSRNFERLKKSAETLEKCTNQRCLPIQMDVRKPDDVKNGVSKVISEFKHIDFLVNSAAGNFLAPAAAISANGFKNVIDIDLNGTFNVTRAVYDQSFKDNGGAIVSITATLPYRGSALMAHAGSAKAGIEALTRHLAVEWGPSGIRINCVAPGPITDTEGFRKLGGNFIPEEHFKSIPLQRAGEKVEIANTTLFLLSDAASLITGTTVVADGGEWLGSPNSMYMMTKLMEHHQKTQSKQ